MWTSEGGTTKSRDLNRTCCVWHQAWCVCCSSYAEWRPPLGAPWRHKLCLRCLCVLGTWHNIQIRIQSRRCSSLLKTGGHVASGQDQFSVRPRANHTTYTGSLSRTPRDAAKTAPPSSLRSHTMDSATDRQNYGCLLWFAYFCLKCRWHCWKFKGISRMLQFCQLTYRMIAK